MENTAIYNCRWCNGLYCINCSEGVKDYKNYCSESCEEESKKVEARTNTILKSRRK